MNRIDSLEEHCLTFAFIHRQFFQQDTSLGMAYRKS